MKPAFVLIPDTGAAVNRKRYLKDCMKYVFSHGHFPLSVDAYETYLSSDQERFISQMLGFCQTVYLFIDFGITKDMSRTSEMAAKQDIPVYFVKISENYPKEYETSLADILQEVSEKAKIPIEDLKSKIRKREMVDTRDIYYRRVKEVCGKKYSLAKIGREVNRDHATVLYGIKEANETMEIVDQYQEYYGSNGTGK